MKRTASLILIGLFYLLSFWAGYLFCLFLRDYLDIYLNLFLGTTISTLMIYFFNIILKNASVYDAYWSVQPIFLIFAFYTITGKEYNFEPVHLIILIPLAIWAIRLTINWAYGFESLEWEDWRYKMLKGKTSNKVFRELLVFFGIMYIPTVVVYFCTLPLFTSFMASGNNQVLFYIIGGVIVLIGTVLQIIADYQMLTFRKKKLGTNIDSGLWKYSRHPNYLGELLIWTGVFIAALNNFSWLNIIGVILVYLLFFFISIPLAENRYLEKYPAYVEYKKRTSVLLLLPKKKVNEQPK